jgi:glutamine amidotransferase
VADTAEDRPKRMTRRGAPDGTLVVDHRERGGHAMCRWMAWHGQPVLIEELLFRTQHGLIDQSLHSRLGAETTNGDGFGVGWYGTGEGPGVYRSVAPAWGDANLRHLAGHIESPLFLSHVRATSGTAIQQTNCHPFRHGRWLLVHNGVIGDFRALRRDLMLLVDPARFPDIEGSTDSEVLFHLALTLGLEADPVAALEQAIGTVETVARSHGLQPAIQASVGVSDGDSLWAVRYASAEEPRSLFVSADAATVRSLRPADERVQRLRDGDRLIVSEPVDDLPGDWHEIEPSSVLIVRPGGDLERRAFRPVADVAAPA